MVGTIKILLLGGNNRARNSDTNLLRNSPLDCFSQIKIWSSLSQVRAATQTAYIAQINLSSLLLLGGNNRVRTCDPLLVRQVLSQLSYAPILALATGYIIQYYYLKVNTFFSFFNNLNGIFHQLFNIIRSKHIFFIAKMAFYFGIIFIISHFL